MPRALNAMRSTAQMGRKRRHLRSATFSQELNCASRRGRLRLGDFRQVLAPDQANNLAQLSILTPASKLKGNLKNLGIARRFLPITQVALEMLLKNAQEIKIRLHGSGHRSVFESYFFHP